LGAGRRRIGQDGARGLFSGEVLGAHNGSVEYPDPGGGKGAGFQAAWFGVGIRSGAYGFSHLRCGVKRGSIRSERVEL